MKKSDGHPARLSNGLSPQVYWALSLLLVAGYLALWLANFRYVYGWHADDWACYVKGVDTVEDPKAAFTVRANALQPYFYLYSYLPIWSGISVPSYELPMYGHLTGNFRFFLLYTIVFHGLVALSWAWFAGRIAGNRTAALISTLLFLTSQEFVLWTPQPETRFVGLPLALIGIWLMVRPDPLPATATGPAQRGWRRAGWLFLAGSLFGLAQSLHYTVLYLIVPVSAAVWLWELHDGWRRMRWWTGWAVFGLGCVWLQGLLELLSLYWINWPWWGGPTMALRKLNLDNMSPYSISTHGMIVGGQALELIGWPLLATSLAGAWIWLRGVPENEGLEPKRRIAVLCGVVLGTTLIVVSPTLPYFRKLSNLQPFYFLFAGWAVVWLAERVSRRKLRCAAVCLVFLLAIDIVPLRRSAEVFRGHLGLGRVVHWAHQHRGDRKLRWLIARRPYLYTLDDLLVDDPENWVITYFPYEPLVVYPSTAYCLEAATPLYKQATLWATESAQAVHEVKWHTYIHREGLLADARVYRAGDLAACWQTRATVYVAETRADPSMSPEYEPGNMFDHDAGPDKTTAWVSAVHPPPHRIEILLEKETQLDSLAIVQRVLDGTRIARLHLRVAPSKGPLRTVWMGSRLQDQQVVIARFVPQPVQRIELECRGYRSLFHCPDMVQIEEIIFPGYRVEAAPPTRSLPPLVLHSLEQADNGTLTAHGKGITPHTRLVLARRPVRSDHVQLNQETILDYRLIFHYPDDVLHARFTDALLAPGNQLPVWLSDGLRRSNQLEVECRGDRVVVVPRGAAPADRQTRTANLPNHPE